MFKTLLTFGIGVYTGIYLAQYHELEKIDPPQILWTKFMKYVEENASDEKKK